MANSICITKKSALKGEDGYKVVSVRLRDDIIESIDLISSETNRSRNELINILLREAVKNVEITD